MYSCLPRVRDWGVPCSVYQDKHTALKRNDDWLSLEEEPAGTREPTQVGMALGDLGIEAIFANSPQAKGRVEKLFETLQDRLVAELGLRGIKEIEAANEYMASVFIFTVLYSISSQGRTVGAMQASRRTCARCLMARGGYTIRAS